MSFFDRMEKVDEVDFVCGVEVVEITEGWKYIIPTAILY